MYSNNHLYFTVLIWLASHSLAKFLYFVCTEVTEAIAMEYCYWNRDVLAILIFTSFQSVLSAKAKMQINKIRLFSIFNSSY